MHKMRKSLLFLLAHLLYRSFGSPKTELLHSHLAIVVVVVRLSQYFGYFLFDWLFVLVLNIL